MMNLFINKGRCRVCGKIFCCTIHQKEHEKLEHKEYSHWLKILPIMCRVCHRTIVTICDLNTECFQLNRHHRFIAGNFGAVNVSRQNRKRQLNSKILVNAKIGVGLLESRKKLVPSYRLKKKSTFSSNIYLVDVSGIRITDTVFNTIISPPLNVSYKILKTNVKSSTPLIDNKENLAFVSVSVDNEIKITAYTTPENVSVSTSVILVSALKKSSTPRDGIMKCQPGTKKNADRRRVTFDISSPEQEVSVYGTPEVSMNVDQSDSDFQKASDKKEPPGFRIFTIAKNFRITLNDLPRSLLNMWEWTQRKIRRYRDENDMSSPVAKRRKLNLNLLKRRPISSYWVNMSGSSLIREPLPNYVDKYTFVNMTDV